MSALHIFNNMSVLFNVYEETLPKIYLTTLNCPSLKWAPVVWWALFLNWNGTHSLYSEVLFFKLSWRSLTSCTTKSDVLSWRTEGHSGVEACSLFSSPVEEAWCCLSSGQRQHWSAAVTLSQSPGKEGLCQAWITALFRLAEDVLSEAPIQHESKWTFCAHNLSFNQILPRLVLTAIIMRRITH